MSSIVDTCAEQAIGIETWIRLLVYCNENGNQYINTCNSEFNPNDLLPLDCEYSGAESLLREIIDEDESGNPCIRWVSTDNTLFFCTNELDFRFSCNSQYLTVM